MRRTIARITFATALTASVLGATAGTAFAGQNSSAVMSLGKLGRVEVTAPAGTR